MSHLEDGARFALKTRVTTATSSHITARPGARRAIDHRRTRYNLRRTICKIQG
jgi:hypothetical protein